MKARSFFFKIDVNPNLIKVFYALGGGIFNIRIHRETEVHNCHEVEKEVEWMLITFYFNQTKNKQPKVLLEKKM